MYALIHDKEIRVGPRNWNYSSFKEYLDSKSLDSSMLPLIAPRDGKIITDEWKIVPATIINTPSYDSLYEQLSGPFWTIDLDHVTGIYDVVPVSLDFSKNVLKQKITETRYVVEVSGCKFVLNDSTEVMLHTSRENRNVYMHAYQNVVDNESVTFKFDNSLFKLITKDELARMTASVAAHIQAAFNWEANKYIEIEACNDVDQLKLVDIQYQQRAS